MTLLMDFFDSTKSIVENLYLLSGPLLVILGLFIFRQIQIAREHIIIAKKQLIESQEQLKINSQRLATSIAAEKVKEYLNEIIPLKNKLFDLSIKLNYPLFENGIGDFTHKDIERWDKEFLKAYVDRPDEISDLELEIINRLEALAIYFIKGIADESIAFTSIGASFCDIYAIYPVLTVFRGNKNINKYYDNLITLYDCWSKRLESYKLEFESKEISKDLERKLENLKKKRSEITTPTSPIGTAI